MSKTSWRHHYIPKFYLRNFTNREGKFHIYIVSKEDFKENGKLFSPETHFFEQDGNTLDFGTISTDSLETHFYKQLDDESSKLFYKIKHSTEPRYGLSEKDMPAMQYFIAHLFWRNPSNDEFVKQLIRDKGLEYFGITIVDRKTNEPITQDKLLKSIDENGSTYKLVKYWLPTALYNDLIKSKKPLTILNFDVGRKPSLIGDNPLILRNPEKYDVYTDDLILPLCKGKILIRTEKVRMEYSNTIQINLDRLLLLQSNTYTATTNMKYIEMLKNLTPALSLDEIRLDIFNALVE